MRITIMKKLILASAIMLAMTACETGTSSNSSSGGKVDYGFSCKVTRTDNSVNVYETLMGMVYDETSTVKLGDDGYYYTEIVTKESYPTAYAADDACDAAVRDRVGELFRRAGGRRARRGARVGG